MAPLSQVAAAYNLAVLVVRHERKSGGDLADAGRGSSAFDGAVDLVVTFRKTDGDPEANRRRRMVHTVGRFDGLPEEPMTIELVDDRYVFLGGREEVAHAAVKNWLLTEMLPTSEDEAMPIESKTVPEEKTIAYHAKEKQFSTQLVRKVMGELTKSGAVIKTGDGHKGSAYGYWRAARSVGEDYPTVI